jgi:zinc and cadmium transporter
MIAAPGLADLGRIVVLTAAGGLGSALAAGIFVALPARQRHHIVPHLVSYATGALLGAALIGLLPEAIDGAGLANAPKVGIALLLGLLLFFVLEKLVLWRHCHDDPCEAHAPAHGPNDTHRDRSSASMILIGDGFHNLLDGVVIAAAYLTQPELGVATAIAVFAHELPQEVGDIAILLHGGMSRARAMCLNLLTSLTAVLGAVIAFYAMRTALDQLPYALAIAAACLLYVAVADLIPGLHRRVDAKTSLQQVALILLGILTIWLTQPQAGGGGPPV